VDDYPASRKFAQCFWETSSWESYYSGILLRCWSSYPGQMCGSISRSSSFRWSPDFVGFYEKELLIGHEPAEAEHAHQASAVSWPLCPKLYGILSWFPWFCGYHLLPRLWWVQVCSWTKENHSPPCFWYPPTRCYQTEKSNWRCQLRSKVNLHRSSFWLIWARKIFLKFSSETFCWFSDLLTASLISNYFSF